MEQVRKIGSYEDLKMPSRFDNFEQSEMGQLLKSLTEGSDRLIEFKAFVREGFPAVTALVSELSPILMPLKSSDLKMFNFAKQSVGDFVARIMREAGFKKSGQRSVPGKLFTVGALWITN